MDYLSVRMHTSAVFREIGIEEWRCAKRSVKSGYATKETSLR